MQLCGMLMAVTGLCSLSENLPVVVWMLMSPPQADILDPVLQVGKIFSEVVGSSGGRGLAGKSGSLASYSEEDNLSPLLMPALCDSYSATLIYHHYHEPYYDGPQTSEILHQNIPFFPSIGAIRHRNTRETNIFLFHSS